MSHTITQTQDSAFAGEAAKGPSAVLPRGATLGRYVVLELVGTGGMGVVYAAYDFGLDRKVSLKLVRGDRRARERQERLVREAQAMARLSHPNVIAVHDVGTYEDQVFIAMEFVAGGTLKQWLHAQPRTWQQVVDMFLQAGRGLAAAHRAGLVHRDFKPENVLLGTDGRARVTDFGLAIDTDYDEERPVVLRVDGTPAVAGTTGYIAPELRRGVTAGPRSDQYAFCVALHEGLCGWRPADNTPSEALLASRVPRPLVRLIERGLAPKPEDRFSTLDELLAEMERCRYPGRRRLAAVGGLSLAGSLAALSAFVLASQPRPAPASLAREAPVSTPVVTWVPVPVAPTTCTLPAGSGPLQAPSVAPALDAHEPQAQASARKSVELAAPVAAEPRAPAGSFAAPFARSAAPAPLTRPAQPSSTRWADEARRLADELQRDGLSDHPLKQLVASVLERLQRLLDGSPDPVEPRGTLLASSDVAQSGNGAPQPVTWKLVPGQAPTEPFATTYTWPANTGRANQAAPLDQRSVDALELALAQNVASHKSPGEIAQVRFALAQALWKAKRDPNRAVALAQQAEDDLLGTPEHPDLKVEVSVWLQEKLEWLRQSHANGGP